MRLKVYSATLAATLPYLCWMVLLLALPATPEMYALRTLCAALLLIPAAQELWKCPAQHWGPTLFWGTLTGLIVFLLWIAPEPYKWYQQLFILGGLPSADTASAYAPSECGWPLTLARLIGSAFIIAPAEELFFRGFLYRRLQSKDWQSVPTTQFDASAFWWTVGLFALEHNRWLVGAIAGALYGFIAIRKGLGAAILAHIVTNLVLALYVIRFEQWAFW